VTTPRSVRLALLLMTAAVAAWPATADVAADEAAIRALIAAQVDAWNRGDAEAHAAAFREDVLFTNILGMTYGTRAEFEQRHSVIFSTFFRGSRLAMTIRALRFPAPDFALVDLETALTGFQALPPGVAAGPDGGLHTRLLQVMVRSGGAWQVAAYHNVDVKTAPTAR